MSSEAATPQWLDRAAAAEWAQRRGLRHVTADYLRKAAAAGNGPRHHRMGKFALYAPEDLEAWLTASIKPAGEGRRPPRAA